LRIYEEVDDSTSFGRLFNLIVNEVITSRPSGRDVPETYVERSLASDGEAGAGYPRLFAGFETTERPFIEFCADPNTGEVICTGEVLKAAKPYVWFNPNTGRSEEAVEIAHINIGTIVGNREGRQYRHTLTHDKKVIREVIRKDGPQLPVEQARILNDEAIDGLVQRLVA